MQSREIRFDSNEVGELLSMFMLVIDIFSILPDGPNRAEIQYRSLKFFEADHPKCGTIQNGV